MDNPKILARVKEIAPGCYTERDGGDWYALAPTTSDIGRLAEGFGDRDNARLLLCFLAGDPLPKGWRLTPNGKGGLSYDIEIPGDYTATLWARDARKLFPARAEAFPVIATP